MIRVPNGLIITAVVVVFIITGWFLFFASSQSLQVPNKQLISSDATDSYVVPPMERDYTNEQFKFSLKLPQGYTVSELPFDGKGTAVVLQDESNNGIQIYVTENAGDIHELTAEMVHEAIPDMQILDVQPVEIGQGHRGIAFMSDNEAYGGASREVWFFFEGNLYQISTYARLDALLQSIFNTWLFI